MGGKTLPSYPFSTYPTFWVLGWPSSGCRTRRGARGQLQGEQGDRGAVSQHLQGGSTAPACARGTGLRVSTFRYSFLPPLPCSCQVSNSCCEGEELQSQASLKKKTKIQHKLFILHVLLTVTAWRHCSCQSYYETNQVPDSSGLALPHPQESQHCTKLYLQGKQSETGSPKKTPCNSKEKNIQDKCDSYALRTARLPTGSSRGWWKPRASSHRLLKGAWQS